MSYKHIVFDVDGTLIDTETACLLSLRDLIKEELGQDRKTEDLKFCLGRAGKDSLTMAGFLDWKKSYDRWLEILAEYDNEVKVFDGLREVLEVLQKEGYQLGVVTSRNLKGAVMDLRAHGIESYFKTIVCCDDTEKHKPFPDPLLKYLEKNNCDSSEVLYLGDTEHDLKCAGGADIDFALAGWGAPVMLEAKYVLRHPSELLELVKK